MHLLPLLDRRRDRRRPAYLGVRGGRGVLEDGRVHEDGAVVVVEVVEQRRERLLQAAVPLAAHRAAVAGGLRGQAQRQPAEGRLAQRAHRAILAAHAAAAAAQPRRADHQRQLQHQLLTAGDVDVDLREHSDAEMRCELLKDIP